MEPENATPDLSEPALRTHTPLRGWAIFILFQQMGSFATLVSFTFGLMLPSIRKDVGLSDTQAGALAAVAWAVSAVLAVPFAAYFSRFNPVRLVGVMAALVAICVALQSIAASFAMLFAIRFASVILQASQAPARPILIQQWISLRHIATANGLSFAFHSIIQALALSTLAVVIGWLGGWRETYIALGAAMGVFVILWHVVARERVDAGPPARRQPQPSMLIVLRYKPVLILAAAQMAPAAMWTALLAFLPTYLEEDRGLSLGVAGLAVGILYWGAATSGFLAGFLDRRVPNRKALIAGPAVLFLVGGLGILLIPNPYVVAVFAFFLGIGWIMQPIISTLPYHLPGIKPRELAVVNGFLMMTASVGFALGPIIAGIIADVTGSMLTALVSVTLLCITSVGFGLAYPVNRPPESPREAGGGAVGSPASVIPRRANS